MPKRSSNPGKQEGDAEDPNVTAFNAIEQATREVEPAPEVPYDKPPPEKNPAAVALGRLGGKKGGKARAEKLSPERRSEIARAAAAARWQRRPKPAKPDTASQ